MGACDAVHPSSKVATFHGDSAQRDCLNGLGPAYVSITSVSGHGLRIWKCLDELTRGRRHIADSHRNAELVRRYVEASDQVRQLVSCYGSAYGRRDVFLDHRNEQGMALEGSQR